MTTTIYQQVNQELLCDHKRVNLTYRLASNGMKQFRYQCQECGQIVGKASLPHASILARDRDAATPFDEEIRKAYWERRSARFTEIAQQQRQEEADAWQEDRDEYMRSAQWAMLRYKVLKRDRMCQGCGDRLAVEVHHLTYQRWRREMLFDLIGVCEVCHRNIHEG